ncbi:MAG: restriction endonuclease [Candidatus Pacebacteria bacterium]|nr:restriction endonuclease [Candidatus Paceibacterota bacterium]
MTYNVLNSFKEQEPFSYKKVYNSLLLAGKDEETAAKIASLVEKKAYPNISTFEIHKMIKKILLKEKNAFSMRFDLKYAMKRFGPEGFYFEKFIKEVYEFLGYEVVNNEIVQGKCIPYEIDFIAKKDELEFMGECKYRNMVGDRVDVNVVLKGFAVRDDIRNNNSNIIEKIIVTNEKFTERAIKYAKCKKIFLLGWKFPEEMGLEKIIEDNGLYPITILNSFNSRYLNVFAKENVLIAKNLTEEKIKKLHEYKISRGYLNKLKQEKELLFN